MLKFAPPPRVLLLNLKREYFRDIAAGRKLEEYRAYNQYWRRRLEGREFDLIRIACGYPRADDASRHLIRKWNGYTVKTITHPFFGPDPVKVFAIDVSQEG